MFLGIPLIPHLINLIKFMGVDNMEVIKNLIIEIIIQLLVGEINGPLAVEKE